MNNQWMKKTLLAVSIHMLIGGAYAAETITDTESENTNEAISTEAQDTVATATAIADSQ